MTDPATPVPGDTIEGETPAEARSLRRKCKASTMDSTKLMRKRATDRRSQQAFRERTKLKIAALEEEVARMSQNAEKMSRELHEVTLQRNSLSTECLEWKEKASLASELEAEVHAMARRLDQLRTKKPFSDAELSSIRPSLPAGILPTIHSDMTPRRSNQDQDANDYALAPSPARSNTSAAMETQSSPPLPQPSGLSTCEGPTERSASYEATRFAPGAACLTSFPHPQNVDVRTDFLSEGVGFDPVCFPVSVGHTSPQHGDAHILRRTSQDPLNDELSEPVTADEVSIDLSAHGATGDVSARSPVQVPDPSIPDEMQLQPLSTEQSSRWPGGWSPTSSNQVDLCEQLPYNLKPVIPSDRILQGLIASQRGAAAEGIPWDELLGPELPCWDVLVGAPSRLCGHPICRAVFDIVKAYTGYSRLPERVASVYTMYSSVMWRLSLQRKRFEKMPLWMRPRAIQLQVAHPAWMDRVPWQVPLHPNLREILVKDQELYHVEEFGAFHSTSVSVNWPYSSDCVLITSRGSAAKEDETVLSLNPAFEEHIRDLRNWTIGSRFTQKYPELAAAIEQDIGDGSIEE
ncbi:hypothetical protein Z517_11598 [Fonsecaea pedrosoi CBS 271.37]|uniref:BZIP domain-containing protein n=1 Tax=Fonsecaea pedrosoi CBS 271.37 TaxID=1442368 RepID=A0A0D2G207_9EURO|nr:uncharacterized protein Z517_11598 [Fonsecaea pedrosoi CBS 271.37]KIW74828.1 hypothetical protein Z517_11598 [Fonsecaea pedrosoi CBS 271.37]